MFHNVIIIVKLNFNSKLNPEKGDFIARVTKHFRPWFSKTLVLVKCRG